MVDVFLICIYSFNSEIWEFIQNNTIKPNIRSISASFLTLRSLFHDFFFNFARVVNKMLIFPDTIYITGMHVRLLGRF